MTINFSLKVGKTLGCNFGNYPVSQNGQFSIKYYDGHIPPEMIKDRLVVALNGKINGNARIVVPLSITRDHDKLDRGVYVEVASNAINGLQFFDQQICWAKVDLVQQVSWNRLNGVRTYRGYLNQCLPHELVADIQRAIIKSTNAIPLIN